MYRTVGRHAWRAAAAGRRAWVGEGERRAAADRELGFSQDRGLISDKLKGSFANRQGRDVAAAFLNTSLGKRRGAPWRGQIPVAFKNFDLIQAELVLPKLQLH